jgi:hypothetical protein
MNDFFSFFLHHKDTLAIALFFVLVFAALLIWEINYQGKERQKRDAHTMDEGTKPVTYDASKKPTENGFDAMSVW